MAPLFDKADTALLKTWIVKRLENTSDADADVLADYVLALLQHDGDVKSIRKLCEEEIRDFLKEEDSTSFIDDVFKTLSDKLYLPPDARHKSADPPAYDPSQRLEGFTPNHQPTAPNPAQYPEAATLSGSKKRSYHDRLEGEAQGASGPEPDARRTFKQQRLGYNGSDARQGNTAAPFSMGYPRAPGLLSPSAVYANLPLLPFDPADPQSFPFPPNMYANQAAGGRNPFARKKKRCWEFDAKGYCSRGLSCNYDHSVDLSAMAPLQPAGIDSDEGYDPNDPTFILQPPSFAMPPFPLPARGSNRRRRGESRRGGRGRAKAAFSADGPVHDPSQPAIVVENIPEESFSEEQVREFFSQFGTVVEISMRPYKRLAIVKYDSHKSADLAYRSPKVIFDNRFVKVFWYKEEHDGPTLGRGKASNGANGFDDPSMGNDEPEIDMEDFMQKQTEAQKIYEEKKERREALLKQKEELDRRQQELLVRQLEAKQKLEARLGNESASDAAPNSTTELLRAQLKRLEEEAKILGLDPNVTSSHPHAEGGYSGHEGSWTRGGYRGRGGFRGRGRGGFRGGYGSGFGGVHEAYAAYSLDNRPKKVAVAGMDFTVPAKDEVLRQYLLGIGEFMAIESTPSITHISFKERKTAESFLVGLNGKTLPEQEETLTVTWVPNGTASIAATGNEEQDDETTTAEESGKKKETADVKQGKDDEEMEEGEIQGEMDYEVADEAEWGV